MIVGLSWAELQACRHWGSQLHREYLSSHRTRSAQGWHHVAMPAIGWRTLADRLVREAFHAGSGRHRKTRNQVDGVPATRQAARKIENSLAQVAMHPALRGQGQAGTSGEVLMVFRKPGTASEYTLYPMPGTEPVFMVPSYLEVAGVGPTTIWNPEPEPPCEIDGLFADVSLHEGFS